MMNVLRKGLLTLWFWLGVSISTALTGIVYVIYKLVWSSITTPSEHDVITWLIENVMTEMIMLWMTTPGFWKVNHMVVKTQSRALSESVPESERTEDNANPKSDPDGPFLLAANHNSLIDTLFISDLRYKKTYTYNVKWAMVPVFGWLCVFAGYIGIDTSNAKAKAEVVPKVCRAIKNGYSVMVYPQGTRSRAPDDLLKTYDAKTGAFRVAAETGCQILPIFIRGSDKIVNRRGVVDSGTVDIVYGEPFSGDDVEDLRKCWVHKLNMINLSFRNQSGPPMVTSSMPIDSSS